MKTTSTWRRAIAVGCLGAMSLGLTGCSIINGACRSLKQQECLDEFMIGYRNQALAAKAWHRVKNCYKNKTYYDDFKTGFFAGYADVAAGGPGCTPAVAPTSYWGWRYQSRDGQAAVNAYFEGYPLGVKAAEQDGVGHWGSVRPNFQKPQPFQPLVAAPIASSSDRGRNAGAEENPFYPQPVPETESRGGDEEMDKSLDGGGDGELAGIRAGVNETSIELGASLGIAVLGGVQRVVFAGALPASVPSESFTQAVEAPGPEIDVVAAFVRSGRAALLVAAVLILLVAPWAIRQLGDEP